MFSSTPRRLSTVICTLGVILSLFVLTGVGIFQALKETATAAPSTYLNFQARLKNGSGGIVPDGNYNIEFNLYDDATSGTLLWTETRTGADKVRVANGYMTVNLGSVTAFPGTINWGERIWLTMNVGGTGSPSWDGEMNPRLLLTAIPHAFKADSANNVASANTNAASTNSNAVSIASGNATGTTSNSGNITIDAGTATGTAGTISLGATNASGLILGRSGLTTQNAGNLTVQGGTTTLGTTSQAGLLVVSDGSSHTGTIQTASLGSNEIYILPDSDGSDTFCLVDLANCAGSATTLQATYDADADGSDAVIAVTATDGAIIFRDASSTIGTIFVVEANGGGDYLSVASTGTTIATTGGSGIALTVDNGTSTGNILSLKDNGSDVLTVADGGAVTLTNNISIQGNTTLGNATSDTITFTGRVDSSILPSVNDTYDLGSDSNRWRDVYLGGETIHMGTSTSDEATLGYNTTTNSLVIKNAVDSTSSFQIQNADSSQTVFNVDTVNGRVGVGTATPVSTLEVSQADVPTTVLTVSYAATPSSGTTAYSAINFGAKDTPGASWTTSNDSSESYVWAMVTDNVNGVIYASTNPNAFIYRCEISTNCDAAGDWTISLDIIATWPYSLAIDEGNGVIYSGSDNGGIIRRCDLSTSCDTSGDWTTSYDSADGSIYSIKVDEANGVIYAGSNSGGNIFRCDTSTNCDADGDWTTSYDTSETIIGTFTIDTTNGVLYAGSSSGGIIFRCALSTSCDASGDWTTSNDTSESSILSLEFDPANGVLYAGTSTNGIIMRCAVSTSCDASGDWTTSYDTAGTQIQALLVDSNNGTIYAGTNNSGIVYVCSLSTACDASGDWTTSYDSASTVIMSLTMDTTNDVIYAGSATGGIIYRLDGIGSGGSNTNYSQLLAYATDNVNGSEDGALGFSTLVNGTAVQGMYLQGGSLTVGNATNAGSLSVANGSGGNWLSVTSAGNTTIQSGSSGVALTVNNSTSAGNILTLQDNGTPVLTVADGGALTVTNAAANAFNLGNSGTLSFVSSLTGGARSSNLLSITQANDASNNNSASLFQLTNSDTGSTVAAIGITQVAGAQGISIGFSSGSSNNGVVVNGSNSTGDAFSSNNYAGGTHFYANYNQATATAGRGFYGLMTQSSATLGAYTGDLFSGQFTRTNTATSGTLTDTGNLLDLNRSTIQNGSGGTFAVTGDLATLTSNCTQTAGTCTDSSNVLSVTQSYTGATGEALMVTNAGSGYSLRINDDGTESDSTPFVVDNTGNVGVGEATPTYLLTVGSGDLFGVNSSGNVLFSDAAHSISVETETTSGAAGNSLTVTAGAANASSTAVTGGHLILNGGASGGSSGNADGGEVRIRGGAATGSGDRGRILLGDSSGSYYLTVNETGGGVNVGALLSGGGTGSNNARLFVQQASSANSGLVVKSFQTTLTTAPLFQLRTSDNQIFLRSGAATYGLLGLNAISGQTEPLVTVTSNGGTTGDRLMMDINGRLGLGETSPQALLHVDGTIRFEDFASCTALETDSDGDLVCGADDGGAGITLQSAYDNDSDGSDAVIALTSTDGAVVVRDASSTIGTLFVVEANGGTDYLTVASTGITLGTSLNAQHILPVTNDTYDLGSDGNRWRDLYLGGETFHIGASTSDEGTISYNTSTNVLSVQSIGNISLGGTATGNSATLMVLPTKTDSGDPTTSQTNGGIYYNSNSGKFRCYEGGTWKDCISGNSSLFTDAGSHTYLTATGDDLALGSSDATDATFYADVSAGSLRVGSTGTADIAGSLVIADSNGDTTTIQAGNSTGGLTFTLPTTTGGANECLKNSGTPGTLTYGSCGSTTLQDAYTADSDGSDTIIALTATDGGLLLRDASSPLTTIFGVQNNGGTASFLGVSASAVTMQDASGNTALLFDSTTSELRVYANTTSPTKYLRMYYDNATDTGVISVSSGTTQIGNGTGDVTISLTNNAEKFEFTHTGTDATSSDVDFDIIRNLTGGSNDLAGAVVKIEDLSTFSGGSSAPDLLYINQNNTSATGNLIMAKTGGATTKFAVSTAGTVTIAAGQAYTGAGALTVSTATGTLTLQAGGANKIIAKPGADSASSFEIQDDSGDILFVADTLNNTLLVGGGDVSPNGTPTLMVLDNKSTGGDPTGVEGGMYYNANTDKFRCYQQSRWLDCVSIWQTLMKTGDEATTSDATVNIDNTLTFSMAANTNYSISCEIFYDTVDAADFSWSTTGPTSPTLVRTLRQWKLPSASAFAGIAVDTAATSQQDLVDTGTTGGYIKFTTTWQNGSNTGSWAFRWSQDVSSGSATTVRAGSYCDYSTF